MAIKYVRSKLRRGGERRWTWQDSMMVACFPYLTLRGYYAGHQPPSRTNGHRAQNQRRTKTPALTYLTLLYPADPLSRAPRSATCLSNDDAVGINGALTAPVPSNNNISIPLSGLTSAAMRQ